MSGTLSVGGKQIFTHSDVTDKVTLSHDIIDGNSSYGFAQLNLTANQSQGNITWSTITGDTTNFTKPSSNHLIQLAIAGVYLINASLSVVLSATERNINISLYNNSGPTLLAVATDQIIYSESDTSYGGGTLTYTGYFSANSQIYFSASSATNANASINSNTHASIVLLRRTA